MDQLANNGGKDENEDFLGSIVDELLTAEEYNFHRSFLDNLNSDEVNNFLSVEDPYLVCSSMDVDQGVNSRWYGQWEKFQYLHQNTTNSAVKNQMERYIREFNDVLEFRSQFAQAIESKCWDSIDMTNLHQPSEADFRMAQAIVYKLLREVSDFLSNRVVSFELKARLLPWQEKLQGHYCNQPMEFIQLIMKVMKKEQNIMEFAQRQTNNSTQTHAVTIKGEQQQNGANDPNFAATQEQKVQHMLQQISELEMKSREIRMQLDGLHNGYQKLQIFVNGNVQELPQFWARPQYSTDPQSQKVWEDVKRAYNDMLTKKMEFIGSFAKGPFYLLLPQLVDGVKQEIAVWQRAQAYAGNGKHCPGTCDIDGLEDCAKPVAQLLNSCLNHIVNMRTLDFGNDYEHKQLDALQGHYEGLVKALVENTLVVEKHPPQVLMKDKKFACQLRHLLGDQISSQQFRFDTKVQLINTETTCAVLQNGPSHPVTPAGTILNNSAKADFVDQTKQLLVHMRNMSLRMKQRGDRTRADCVAEEKFCMVFRANISLRFPSGKEYAAAAQTMSLPLVVISHGKQEADAQATIFWDNAFSEAIRRRPFEVPDTVSWARTLDQLDCLWKKQCRGGGPGNPMQAGRGLDEDAKRYLTIKLFGKDDRNAMNTWRQFNRDGLQPQAFTFWTWFFKILELVSSVYVKSHWNAGRIKGFISKGDSERILKQRGRGTFLFRFSDSKLGAVSISCFTINKDTGVEEVGHLDPDKIDDFKKRSLADTVKDIDYLKVLCVDEGNIPKDQAFRDFYTKPIPESPENPNPYWKKEMRVHTINDSALGECSRPDSPGVFSRGQVTGNVVNHHNFPPSRDVVSPSIFSPASDSSFQASTIFSQLSIDQTMEQTDI